MLILAIDCSGPACAVCVWRDGRILAEAHEDMERGQDARLMPMIIDVMAKAGREFSDLDRVAVTRGPGSFTGVRVGLAAARGIGLAAGKPVIGIDRFAIYQAAYQATDKNLLVVINSKREELFCKFFPSNIKAPTPRGATTDTLTSLEFRARPRGAGESSESFTALMTQSQIDEFIRTHPHTDIIGDMDGDIETISICAALAAAADHADPAYAPLPLYLRAPDVTVAKS